MNVCVSLYMSTKDVIPYEAQGSFSDSNVVSCPGKIKYMVRS